GGDFNGNLMDANTKPATAHFLELTQLVNDWQRRFRRNGKADAYGAPGRGDDGRVHADHLAVEIEQRSARIAAIDGGVSLDVIVIRAGLDVAIARGNDSGRDRSTKAERITDGYHPFAEPQIVAVTEFHRFKRLCRFDLEQRKVGPLIATDDLRPQRGSVIEDDVDFVSIGNDMVVGNNQAGRIDNEAGAERVDASRHGCLIVLSVLTVLAAPILEEFLEELLKWRPRRQLRHRTAIISQIDRLLGRNIDHGVYDLFRHVRYPFGSTRGGGSGQGRPSYGSSS